MAKAKTHYICQACGAVHSKWEGRCSACGAWNTIIEEREEAAPAQSLAASSAKNSASSIEVSNLNAEIILHPRICSGNEEVDRVLGGGFVQGAAILIGGDPGIGKSTLLLQLAARLSHQMQVLYISGEESKSQVQLRAARLGLAGADVQLATATSVRDILQLLKKLPAPSMVVIDSIQTMYVDTVESAPGTVTQVRAASAELIRLTKKREITLVLVGHVTKEGQLAGPRVLEHMVDTVLYFEGERNHMYRVLRSVKNRFGAAGEIGVFSMGERGLEEVANPSALFLSLREVQVSGAAVHAGIEGTRPMLLEFEALVSPNHYSNPRRAVVGWDSARLAMLLAVLETRAGISFADREVYLNVAGGFKVHEPSADLAASIALISAALDIAVPHDVVCLGEIGLSGDIRPVPHMAARVREAAKLGFRKAICPAVGSDLVEGLALPLHPIAHVKQLPEWVACSFGG